MINFSSHNMFNQENRSEFNFELLYDQLWQSFLACGYCDSWLADDILISLIDFYHLESELLLDNETIRKKLVGVLYDNGLSDVADHYYNEHLEADKTPLQVRLQKILTDLTDFPSPMEKEMLYNVEDVVALLPYKEQNITEGLLRELLLCEFKTNSPDLIKSGTLSSIQDKILLPKTQNFSNQPEFYWYPEVIRFSMGGYIFNSLKIELFPYQLKTMKGNAELIEFQFFQELEKILTEASAFLTEEMADNKNVLDYISLHINDFSQLTKEFTRKDKKLFNEEFHSVFEKSFIKKLSSMAKSIKFYYSS